MKSNLKHMVPPVSRDRIISRFPKWYTPEACLQFKDHFHAQLRTACQQSTGTAGMKISKVVVVGDVYVGKTSLIHRFCKDHFERDYKATIGVDFEIERFEIVGIPYHLQIWDTAGQEKFKCIASAYYRGAEGENNVNLVLPVTGDFIYTYICSLKKIHAMEWNCHCWEEEETESPMNTFAASSECCDYEVIKNWYPCLGKDGESA